MKHPTSRIVVLLLIVALSIPSIVFGEDIHETLFEQQELVDVDQPSVIESIVDEETHNVLPVESTTDDAVLFDAEQSLEPESEDSEEPVSLGDIGDTVEEEIDNISQEVPTVLVPQEENVSDENIEQTEDPIEESLPLEEVVAEDAEIVIEDETVFPDFTEDAILALNAMPEEGVIVLVETYSEEESSDTQLWFFDEEQGAPILINDQKQTIADFPLGVKGGRLFWLSKDKTSFFSFDRESAVITEHAIPVFDPSRGERAEINLPDFSWTIFIGASDFYFWSLATGEVFSDGDSALPESFREEKDLDAILTDEQLRDLQLSVEVL